MEAGGTGPVLEDAAMSANGAKKPSVHGTWLLAVGRDCKCPVCVAYVVNRNAHYAKLVAAAYGGAA